MWSKTPQKEIEELSAASNIIGKGTVLQGDLLAHGNIRIEGKVLGNVTTKSKLALGHSAYIEGDILAQNAEFAGHVAGNIQVTDQLVLKASTVIDGNIIVNKLIIESGAKFNGSCKMGVKFKEIQIGEKNDYKVESPKSNDIRPLLKKAES